jgi:hypothetical protein
MTTTPEHTPLNLDPEVAVVLEKPTKYPFEWLQKTFAPEDIVAVSEYQRGLEADVEKFMDYTLPEEFVEKYHRVLPLLTYNVTMYPELKEKIASDPIIQALRNQKVKTERTAQAMRTRQSILALTASLEQSGA